MNADSFPGDGVTKSSPRPPRDKRSAAWPVLVGAAVMALYVALLPFIARVWRTTGDEPHYLLAAHSLVTDLDLDLSNNYQQLDYLAFYYSRDITPQARTTAGGGQILNHYPGLSVLIAPAYALGGRLGVLLMQAILGGLLAGITFRLAAHISRDERAALVATLAVAFSPPLLMYLYLVYPELIGALLSAVVLYYLVGVSEMGRGGEAAVLLSLMALPWLNRRFIPLAVILALLLVWAWRERPGRRWRPLAVTLVSVGLLLWFNSRLAAPVRADITAPVGAAGLWLRLGRGIGWLLDQQRGLLIYGPVYLSAAGGLLPLSKRPVRSWATVLPFLLAWGVTTVAGGFWIAWEMGPRYLVVGLPGLAPLLALAWRRPLWRWAGLGLLLISLVNSLVIIRHFELPYKSSLPLFYREKSGLPLTEMLPDLAGYARLEPDIAHAPAGQPVRLIEPMPLALPFGHYRLAWPVQVESGLPPESELLRISVKFGGGGLLFNQTVTAAELSDGRVSHAFLNPRPDYRRTPMILHAVSSGRSEIRAGPLRLAPNPLYAWFLPYLILGLIIAGAIWLPAPATSGPERRLPPLPGWTALLLAGLMVLAAGGYLLWQQSRDSRAYEAVDLAHYVGRAVADPGAAGRAWRVDPAVDPPQKAIYGPFEFYGPGRYHVTFRIKALAPIPAETVLARLRVGATANMKELAVQPLRADHFTGPNIYHEFVLPVENPRRQALSFEVAYTGQAALLIDTVTIARQEP